MPLRDPVAVFAADTNLEAQLVRTLLVDAGIEAFAIEDLSYVGTCAWGTLSGINKPQVFVEREDVERALEFLAEREQRNRQLRADDEAERTCQHCGEEVEPGDMICPACGRSTTFPAAPTWLQKTYLWSRRTAGFGTIAAFAFGWAFFPPHLSGFAATPTWQAQLILVVWFSAVTLVSLATLATICFGIRLSLKHGVRCPGIWLAIACCVLLAGFSVQMFN